MKLIYEGKTMFDPQHLRRQRRWPWFTSFCLELVGTCMLLGALYGLTILMFSL